MRTKLSRTGRPTYKDQNRLDALETNLDNRTYHEIKRRKIYLYSRLFSRTVQFECQLYVRGKPFPRYKMMTLFTLKRENDNLAHKFASKLDKDINTTSRLSYWRSTTKTNVTECRDEYISLMIDGVSMQHNTDFYEKHNCQVVPYEKW